MCRGLELLLEQPEASQDLDCVTMGPSGEWFLSNKKGKAWWGGVSQEFERHVKGREDRITFIDFGVEGRYLVRYREAEVSRDWSNT